jgi:hypothetical protein
MEMKSQLNNLVMRMIKSAYFVTKGYPIALRKFPTLCHLYYVYSERRVTRPDASKSPAVTDNISHSIAHSVTVKQQSVSMLISFFRTAQKAKGFHPFPLSSKLL